MLTLLHGGGRALFRWRNLDSAIDFQSQPSFSWHSGEGSFSPLPPTTETEVCEKVFFLGGEDKLDLLGAASGKTAIKTTSFLFFLSFFFFRLVVLHMSTDKKFVFKHISSEKKKEDTKRHLLFPCLFVCVRRAAFKRLKFDALSNKPIFLPPGYFIKSRDPYPLPLSFSLLTFCQAYPSYISTTPTSARVSRLSFGFVSACTGELVSPWGGSPA